MEIKNFQISLKIDSIIYKIEHKKEVRYLGVILDHLLRLNTMSILNCPTLKKFSECTPDFFSTIPTQQSDMLFSYSPYHYLRRTYLVEYKRFPYGKNSQIRAILPTRRIAYL